MVLVSDAKRCVFVHIPKTGGSSLTHLLWPHCEARNRPPHEDIAVDKPGWQEQYHLYGDQHAALSDARIVRALDVDDRLRDYALFAVVRCPYTWLLSYWRSMEGCDPPLAQWLTQARASLRQARYIAAASGGGDAAQAPLNERVRILRFESYERDVRALLGDLDIAPTAPTGATAAAGDGGGDGDGKLPHALKRTPLVLRELLTPAIMATINRDWRDDFVLLRYPMFATVDGLLAWLDAGGAPLHDGECQAPQYLLRAPVRVAPALTDRSGDGAAPRRRRVVVLADDTWSIGRVHHDIGDALKHTYDFTYHHDASFYHDDFRRDFANADVCISTPNIMGSVAQLLAATPERYNRVLFVFHYAANYARICANAHFGQFRYGSISDSIIPATFAKPLYWLPSGIDPSRFRHRCRDGRITALGWCGNLAWGSKRVSWSYEIAHRTHLPVCIATRVPFATMPAWYDDIDVLLVTSGGDASAETGPLPAFEAIACGVLVVGTRVGNFRFVPGPKFATIDEAAAIINKLKAQPDEARTIARQQYEYVMAHFTAERAARHWDAALSDVIAAADSADEATRASS